MVLERIIRPIAPYLSPGYRLFMTKRRAAPQKPSKLTHFLSLPILTPTSTPQLIASLAHLRASIPSAPKPTAVQDAEGKSWVVDLPTDLFPDEALRPIGALHLTLGTMRLEDEDRLRRAKELLEGLDLAQYLKASEERDQSIAPEAVIQSPAEAIGSRSTAESSSLSPLSISLEGLFDFHSSEKLTRLLARPVDPTNRLVAFATAVRQPFVDAELMDVKAHEKELRLHATLVNTIYVRRSGRNRKQPMKFSGRELMELFEEKGGQTDGATGPFVWAKDVEINRVQICEMGAKKVEGEMGQEYSVEAEKLIL